MMGVAITWRSRARLYRAMALLGLVNRTDLPLLDRSGAARASVAPFLALCPDSYLRTNPPPAPLRSSAARASRNALARASAELMT